MIALNLIVSAWGIKRWDEVFGFRLNAINPYKVRDVLADLWCFLNCTFLGVNCSRVWVSYFLLFMLIRHTWRVVWFKINSSLVVFDHLLLYGFLLLFSAKEIPRILNIVRRMLIFDDLVSKRGHICRLPPFLYALLLRFEVDLAHHRSCMLCPSLWLLASHVQHLRIFGIAPHDELHRVAKAFPILLIFYARYILIRWAIRWMLDILR